jgi:hypothetical protein
VSDDVEVPATSDPFDRGLRIAVAVTLPILLFCAVYAALQARFVARDTAALRDEVEALHAQVVKLQQRPVVSTRQAVPSPRPTARRAKAKAGDGEGKAKASKAGKRKAGKAKAQADTEEGVGDATVRDAEGKPRRKGKGTKRRGKNGRKKGKGAKAKAP